MAMNNFVDPEYDRRLEEYKRMKAARKQGEQKEVDSKVQKRF